MSAACKFSKFTRNSNTISNCVVALQVRRTTQSHNIINTIKILTLWLLTNKMKQWQQWFVQCLQHVKCKTNVGKKAPAKKGREKRVLASFCDYCHSSQIKEKCTIGSAGSMYGTIIYLSNARTQYKRLHRSQFGWFNLRHIRTHTKETRTDPSHCYHIWQTVELSIQVAW